jgi:hypothetical protein
MSDWEWKADGLVRWRAPIYGTFGPMPNDNLTIGITQPGTTMPPMHELPGACPWCSTPWSASFHGGRCPKVKAIERYPDGSMKRVEFFDDHEEITR